MENDPLSVPPHIQTIENCLKDLTRLPNVSLVGVKM